MDTAQTTAAPQPTATAATKWSIDPAHTSVTFGVRHMMVSTVRGEFQKVTGTVTWDPAQPEATTIEASLDVASINTREAQRDAHLKSADFLDVEKYPTIEFRSRGVGRSMAGGVEIVGELTIHGTTRVITLQVEGPTAEYKNPWGQTVMGASAKTTIKRSDFGMTWNTVLEAGGLLVGDDISIQLDVELRREQ
ncbi:MAG: polyisoprenoid-binding protein [Myxococcales bacterium 68-20]|nr:MAG: polyisoprenoid-binding protein [Myxococcales bacterium 68-20]